MNKTLFIILLLAIPLRLTAQSIRGITPLPCDFYSQEEPSQILKPGSIVEAKDPDGVVIGRYIVTKENNYGFLTCQIDNPDTPEDEGAQDGDIITFYIDGVRQQKQAIWKAGETIEVDLGITAEAGAFNLHLTQMPGYTNYQQNPAYSGVAVSDMILDYLDSANTDTQPDLMAYADKNKNSETSASELEKLLNDKAPAIYNFGSTATLNRYAALGYIDSFSAANQDDCIKQLCHWIAYKVPQSESGKEYVPIAIATSANPAQGTDSDYKHWMSVAGIRTNQDPFPQLYESAAFGEKYQVAESLELYGVYLNDPACSGLGFHTYINAQEWKDKYFRPMARGLEGESKYAAIMEPPDPQALTVTVKPAQLNKNLEAVLEIPKAGISIYVPGWITEDKKRYLSGILNTVSASQDFNWLTQDSYFVQGLKDSEVNRCYKIAGLSCDDYTIIPFEKIVENKLATTAAVIINNRTGQLRLAAADPDAQELFNPLSLSAAYRALRKHIGWKRNEYLLNFWLSNYEGNPLFPGWSILTAKTERRGAMDILTTTVYSVPNEGKVQEQAGSPQIENLNITRSGYFKLVSFKVLCLKDYTVNIEQKKNVKKSYIYKNGNNYLVIVWGKNAGCCIAIKHKDSTGDFSLGNVTYVYIK